GEIRFLRALAYYDATNLWGDVPLNLKSSSEFTEADENPPLATQALIEDQMIKDLTFAEENMSVSHPPEASARATKGSAKGLLARLYMRRGEWQKAADKCAEVMNSVYDLRSREEGGIVSLFDNNNRS